MNDIDLLSFSAKAAGVEIDDDGTPFTRGVAFNGQPTCDDWNPLTDDGDALRLACALSIDILHNWESVTAQWELGKFCREACTDETRVKATCKAITRAAAEIGKAMP